MRLLGPGQRLAVDANGRFDLARRSPTRRRCRAYDLFWYEEAGDPLDFALQAELAQHYARPDGDRREPVLDAGRAQPDPLRRHAPRPRLAAVRLRAVLRPRRVPAHARDAEGARLVAVALHPARRPPDVARHRGRPAASAATSRIPTCSSPTAASPTASPVEDSIVTLPELPGIGFEGQGRPDRARCARCRPDPRIG